MGSLPSLSLMDCRSIETMEGLVFASPPDLLCALAAALRHSDAGVAKLLRAHPAVLLSSLASHYSDRKQAPESIRELERWCHRHWLKVILKLSRKRHRAQADMISEPSADGGNRDFAFLYRAKTNKQIRKCLVDWLRSQTGCRRRVARKWVKTTVGKQLCFPRKVRAAQKISGPVWATYQDAGQLFQDVFRLRVLDQGYQDELLQAKLDAMKQLAYGASHEINNPLANIATRAQSLLADENHIERRYKLGVIYEQAMRAHEMISDLMLFANPPAIDKQHVDVRIWLASIQRDFDLSVRDRSCGEESGKPIALQVRICSRVTHLNMDPTHLSVAVHELLRNSREAIEQDGTIEVRVERKGARVAISVADDGVGIGEAVKPHLFDPFFSGREAGRGLGFGLSKAWRIAELHDGDLRYDDSDQDKTCFVLSLPV